MKNIKVQIASDDKFDKLITELIVDDDSKKENYIGYIHAENPEDQEKLYIKFQENPPSPRYQDQKGGLNLKDFIVFLQKLYDEECKIRKIEK